MSVVDFGRLPRPHLPTKPEWVELYDFAWKTAAKHIRAHPHHGRPFMDAAWDDTRCYEWVWDTCFMALYCRYGAGQFPGVQSLDNFYDLQRDDGYISMTYDFVARREPWPDRINPPLFAWVEWEHYRTTGDASRLARVLPHIERLMEWIDANRRTAPHRRHGAVDDEPVGEQRGETAQGKLFQLYWFDDCGSSGMDDAPRTPRIKEAGQYFDWIDLSAQMALSFDRISRLYAAIGNRAKSAHWRKRADETGELVNDELWCDRTRFYHDRSLPRNFVASKTAAGFWPMLAGACPPERVDALVAHLLNPAEFHRPIPVPSLSADDPNYCERGTYWVGGVWAPTNYMITRGLVQCGRRDVAHGIARRYVDGLARTFRAVEPHTLWECNAPERDEPGLAAYTQARVKPDFVGWSGLGPIAMLIENLLGLEIDAPAGRITWDIRLTDEHGIRALPLGNVGVADLFCRGREDGDAPASVTIKSDLPLEVELLCAGRKQVIGCTPGQATEARV